MITLRFLIFTGSGRNKACFQIAMIAALVGWSLTFGAPSARALPAFLDLAKKTYGFKENGAIDSKKCNLCHAGVTNKKSLNPFGKDVQAALESSPDRSLTAAMLHALDHKDSDGDGFPNADEFKADTLPGDSASKPAGPAPTPVKPAGGGKIPDQSNPFGPEALLYPKHAQHPIVVHFPIALFMFSMFLDAFSVLRRRPELRAAGYINLVGAAITGLLSVITGLMAWRIQFQGASLLDPSNKWLLYHLVLAVVTTILMLLLWAVRSKEPKNATGAFSRVYIILAFIAVLTITITGHLGGILSGVVQ